MTKNCQKIIFFFLLFAFLGLAFAALAAPKALEVSYPRIPINISASSAPINTDTSAPSYFKYIFGFLIAVAGLLALGVLVYGAFIYITSSGNAVKILDAKNRIFSAIFGLLILLCSWLILNAINPQLVNISLNPPPLVVPEIDHGIFLCTRKVELEEAWYRLQNLNKLPDNQRPKEIDSGIKQILEDIDAFCWKALNSGEVDESVRGKVKFIYVVPAIWTKADGTEEATFYGAILYSNKDFQNKDNAGTRIIYHYQDTEPATFLIKAADFQPLSLQYFQLKKANPAVDWVRLYEAISYNQGQRDKNKVALSYVPLENFETAYDLTQFSGKYIESITITGDLIAILFKTKIFGGATKISDWDWDSTEALTVITANNPNLNQVLPIKEWCKEAAQGFGYGYSQTTHPCAKSLFIVAGNIIQ